VNVRSGEVRLAAEPTSTMTWWSVPNVLVTTVPVHSARTTFALLATMGPERNVPGVAMNEPLRWENAEVGVSALVARFLPQMTMVLVEPMIASLFAAGQAMPGSSRCRRRRRS
jgi:hypothetical protein